jgi:hypothetical protein
VAPPISFTYTGTGRVCKMSCWVSMGRGDWRSSYCFILSVVDLCLSLFENILFLVVVSLRSSNLLVVCFLVLL